MTPNDLASFFRLYNFFRNSGAKENEIESFITNINSGYIPPDKAIGLINQIYEISKSESVPPDQLPNYVRQKLEEKQTLDEQVKQADTTLQTKNVTVEAINEHINLSEELEKHGLSTHDIRKLLNVLSSAKRYGFDGKEIAEKLYNILDLELKERELKDKCKKLSKRISKYKDVVPLTEDIAALGISINELLSLKVAINQAAKMYNLPFVSAIIQLIDDIKRYNKINDLKKELFALQLQKYSLDEGCSRQSQSLINLANLKSNGITEDRILQLNRFLENNKYKYNS
jgi:hypothetical protein